jgi:hypothetical protein
VHGYCERLDGSFWAEPANALTNLAFLVAAVLAAVQVRRGLGRAPLDLAVLSGLLAVISVGSFLFHTLATGWAGLADTVPIGLFMLAYVVVFAHRFAGARPGLAWLAAPVPRRGCSRCRWCCASWTGRCARPGRSARTSAGTCATRRCCTCWCGPLRGV